MHAHLLVQKKPCDPEDKQAVPDLPVASAPRRIQVQGEKLQQRCGEENLVAAMRRRKIRSRKAAEAAQRTKPAARLQNARVASESARVMKNRLRAQHAP
ncbi:hypothetical protein NDU88_004181 [Pleurodeles waltl]|uniref:Uncharacterized protein n=1 Tax=Pleurodeles waltl TaxID=8319 RepID=A0AAV7UEL2_PLEWA|nr:hypothetical protein NDU88_004181 [Pleurodeles waltl]